MTRLEEIVDRLESPDALAEEPFPRRRRLAAACAPSWTKRSSRWSR